MEQRKGILIKGSVFFILLLVAYFFVFQATAYQDEDGLYWFKIYYTEAQKMQALSIIKVLGSRAPEYFPDDLHPYIVAQISVQEAWDYYNAGFQVEEFPDYNVMHSQSLVRSDRGMPGFDCYRTVAETYQAAEDIVAAYPDLADWRDIGDTYLKSSGQGGEDMKVLVLTNKKLVIQKQNILIIGGIHAREYVTAETATRFAEYLVQNYGKDADVTWLLNVNVIHIVLQTNPDGRKMADGTTAQILWRKNMHKHDNNDCTPWPTSTQGGNHYGTDLNRNFLYKWSTTTTDWNVCLEDFPGKSAGSEPETQAVRNYFMNLFRDYNTSPTSPASLDAMGIFIDLHSFSQLVLWPWGYGATLAPNNTQLQTLGRKFSFFNNHTPEQASALYPAAGDTNDDVYAEKGIPAYTFEMGTAFFQSCTTFENTIYPKNLQALIYAAKVAWAPYRLPLGPDALTVKLSNASGPKLTATIDDTRYNNSNGTEATQNIAAAEYYIDAFPAPGWPSTPHAMTAVDGSFNAKSESVTAQVDTTGLLKNQRHLIYVRGKDASNNWGPVSAVFMTWPRVDFTYTTNGQNATFTGIGSDPDPGDGIASWSWNFGDGKTSTSQNPVHYFYKPHTSYKVTLTVKDKSGLSNSVTKSVFIW